MLIGALLIGSTLEAKPIFQLTQTNKGLFGYKTVDWTTGYDQEGHDGWVGNCQEPGLSKCKPPSSMPDPFNETNVMSLVDHALLAIDNGSRSGSKQKSIQVAGENFLRVYTVTWTATDKTTRPSEDVGDGQNISILVDLTEV